jgi:hypothetical protein
MTLVINVTTAARPIFPRRREREARLTDARQRIHVEVE